MYAHRFQSGISSTTQNYIQFALNSNTLNITVMLSIPIFHVIINGSSHMLTSATYLCIIVSFNFMLLRDETMTFITVTC